MFPGQNGSTKTERIGRGEWPQIIVLLLALFSSIYTLWSQTKSWFYAVPIVLTVMVVVLLFRDLGFAGWCKRKWLVVAVNRLARREYPNLVKQIEKAKVHQEICHQFQSSVIWPAAGSDPAQIPNFVSMNFVNWYNDLSHEAQQFKIRRSAELELVGSRFHDFIDVLNHYYLRPYADALRTGRAKYRSEQAMMEIRQRKNTFDRFIEIYNEYCEGLNSKAGRQLLVPIYSMPPPMDWSAAQS